MKKLILMMLLVVGGVMSASAAYLYVNMENPGWWTDDNATTYIHYWEDGKNNANATNWDNVPQMNTIYMYGKKWLSYEIGDGCNRAKLRRFANNAFHNETNEITINGDTYVSLNNNVLTIISAPSWTYVIMRNNIISGQNGEWTNTDMNTVKDGDTFTYTLTKSQIDACNWLSSDGLRFRFHHGDEVHYDDYGTEKSEGQRYTEIAPQSYSELGTNISFGNKITNYYQDVNSGNFWNLKIPTFDYEKIVITADYTTHKWVIRADAYISKTVSGTNQYATFGTTVPVDLSNLGDVTAYTASADATTGKVTLTEKNDALAENEGVLLENTTGSDITLSIPVAASATASTSNNLKAFTGSDKLDRTTENGYTNYILTKVDEKVGFFRVHENGNSMGANTAYLHVANVAGARDFLSFFDDETTNIQTLEKNYAEGKTFNLNGQRVAQPSKGLYIVNGKKVIMK